MLELSQTPLNSSILLFKERYGTSLSWLPKHTASTGTRFIMSTMLTPWSSDDSSDGPRKSPARVVITFDRGRSPDSTATAVLSAGRLSRT